MKDRTTLQPPRIGSSDVSRRRFLTMASLAGTSAIFLAGCGGSSGSGGAGGGGSNSGGSGGITPEDNPPFSQSQVISYYSLASGLQFFLVNQSPNGSQTARIRLYGNDATKTLFTTNGIQAYSTDIFLDSNWVINPISMPVGPNNVRLVTLGGRASIGYAEISWRGGANEVNTVMNDLVPAKGAVHRVPLRLTEAQTVRIAIQNPGTNVLNLELLLRDSEGSTVATITPSIYQLASAQAANALLTDLITNIPRQSDRSFTGSLSIRDTNGNMYNLIAMTEQLSTGAQSGIPATSGQISKQSLLAFPNLYLGDNHDLHFVNTHPSRAERGTITVYDGNGIPLAIKFHGQDALQSSLQITTPPLGSRLVQVLAAENTPGDAYAYYEPDGQPLGTRFFSRTDLTYVEAIATTDGIASPAEIVTTDALLANHCTDGVAITTVCIINPDTVARTYWIELNRRPLLESFTLKPGQQRYGPIYSFFKFNTINPPSSYNGTIRLWGGPIIATSRRDNL